MFAEIERLSNEKIRLASDTYELVDKHIRRLDNDSVKLQATVRQKYLDAAAAAAAKGNKTNGKCLFYVNVNLTIQVFPLYRTHLHE